MNEDKQTEVEAARDVVRAANPIHKTGNREIAIIPKGYDLLNLEQYQDEPARMREHHAFHDVESFILYCSDFRAGFTNGESRMFGSKVNSTFTAIFDYTGWGEHTAKYVCPLSEEWKRWSGMSGKQTNQQAFAQFIEDNLPDVIEPEGAAMLEISRTLEAKKNVNFISNTRLRDSTVDFVFEEKVEATAQKGSIKIPEVFKIKIPVYDNGELHVIQAKLRYRLEGGKLSIWYELDRAHKVLEAAFQAVRKQIEDGLEVKALMGEI